VNKGLERLTHEQALTIKSLRKQLRQSLRISVGAHAVLPSNEEEDEEEDDEDDEDDEEDVDMSGGLDKSIFLTEQMLAEARKGLEYRVRTSELHLGGRVLSGEWNEDI
jgi:hypothetical protein